MACPQSELEAMEDGVPAARVSRASRPAARAVRQPDRTSVRSLSAIHRAADGTDHRRHSPRAGKQVSELEVSHVGLLHGHATARFQRLERLSLQSENALHLPVGGDLSRRVHATYLHVSVVIGNPANHRHDRKVHRSRRGSLRNDQH